MADLPHRGFGSAPNAPFWLVSEHRTVGLVPGRYVLGRGADTDVQILTDPNVSRRHVRLIVTQDAVEVEDLGSSNGTWLDGKLVQHPLRMAVGSKLRIGVEVFELRRLRPQRREPRSKTTIPEIPVVRHAALEMPETATAQDTPVDMVYDQVIALLDKKKVEDAQRFVDPLLDLLELGHRPLHPAALERVAVLALGLAELARDGRYVSWILNEHRRRSRMMSPRTVDLLERALFGGVPVDAEPVETYLAAIVELGLAGTPDEAALAARIRDAAASRGFTVPAPPPEVR